MYIVIEKHGGWEYASIVTNSNGDVQVFKDVDNAIEEANSCQDGIVVGDGGNETLINSFANDLHQIYSLLEEEGVDVATVKGFIKNLIIQLKPIKLWK